jgi:Fe-coproporphyrin III synthase
LRAAPCEITTLTRAGPRWFIASARAPFRSLHCYSSSGPRERDELDVATLMGAIVDANSEGYNAVAISGGEPLLYERLRDLLDCPHRCGMFTSVTSNGMLLDTTRLEWLRGAVDLLAISVDGTPESHNRMRASERAYETMLSRLEGVRNAGIPLGFIFTLTQHNVHELELVAQFAVQGSEASADSPA